MPRWPGSGCPKEHLRGIGRWVREAGLGTQTGREAERGQDEWGQEGRGARGSAG